MFAECWHKSSGVDEDLFQDSAPQANVHEPCMRKGLTRTSTRKEMFMSSAPAQQTAYTTIQDIFETENPKPNRVCPARSPALPLHLTARSARDAILRVDHSFFCMRLGWGLAYPGGLERALN